MFDFHFHIHDQKQLTEVLEKVTKILKQSTMAQETLAELKAYAQETQTSLTNIKGDITRIVENLPAEGGLSAEEVADLRNTLIATRDQAKALDEENQPEGEQPPQG